MIFWLDCKLFGNGYGMAEPYCDGVFYWLRDLSPGRERSKSLRGGNFYRLSGGLGAQLHSFEWYSPKPGERRFLANEWFEVFRVNRRWLRVEVAWSAVDRHSIEDINALQNKIKDWGHGHP